MTSKHWREERMGRNAVIKMIGEGNKVESFEIDRNHEKGLEIHTITTNAIIIITNKETGKMITKLIAREGQIKRYYEKEGRKAPQEIIEKARENTKKGYNLM